MPSKNRKQTLAESTPWRPGADLLFSTQSKAEFECLELFYSCQHYKITFLRPEIWAIDSIIRKLIKGK